MSRKEPRAWSVLNIRHEEVGGTNMPGHLPACLDNEDKTADHRTPRTTIVTNTSKASRVSSYSLTNPASKLYLSQHVAKLYSVGPAWRPHSALLPNSSTIDEPLALDSIDLSTGEIVIRFGELRITVSFWYTDSFDLLLRSRNDQTGSEARIPECFLRPLDCAAARLPSLMMMNKLKEFHNVQIYALLDLT